MSRNSLKSLILYLSKSQKLLFNKIYLGYNYSNRHLSVHSTNEEEVKEVDIAIFGGGVIGSSIAYWIQQRLPNQIRCAVIERDPTYSKCSTTLSVGGIRQQFSIEENIQLSLLSSYFIQNIEKYLSVHGQTLPYIGFTPNGYLLTASESGAEQLIRNHKLQTELGANIQLLTTDKLKLKFPWLNEQGIALATYGCQHEGWFDPWALLSAFKLKAQSLGVNYINGNVVGFDGKDSPQIDSQIQTKKEVVIRKPDQTLRTLSFGTGIVCCGAHSSTIAEYLGYGSEETGVKSVVLPIEPRKRYVYVIHCVDGPDPQTPLFCDTTGVYFRPEGKSGNYLCGRCPEENEEPDISNLEVDYSYFESSIWPHLAQRVKAFESIKLKNSWSGFYDYNRLDQNAVIGRDPYYNNIYWCSGFSGHGIQMSPAVGKAVSELVLDNEYKTLDLSRFGWERLINNKPLKELNVY